MVGIIESEQVNRTAMPGRDRLELGNYRMPTLESFRRGLGDYLFFDQGEMSRAVFNVIDESCQRINSKIPTDWNFVATPFSMGNATFASYDCHDVAISDRSIGLMLNGRHKGILCKVEDRAALVESIENLVEPYGLGVLDGTHSVKMATLSGRDLYTVGGVSFRDVKVTPLEYSTFVDGQHFVNVAIALVVPTVTKYSQRAAAAISNDLEQALSPDLLKAIHAKISSYNQKALSDLEQASAVEEGKKIAFEAYSSKLEQDFFSKSKDLSIDPVIWSDSVKKYPSAQWGNPIPDPYKRLNSASATLMASTAIFGDSALTDFNVLNSKTAQLKKAIETIFNKANIDVQIQIYPPRKFPDATAEYLAEKENEEHLYPLNSLKEKLPITISFTNLQQLLSIPKAQAIQLGTELLSLIK